MNYRRFVVVGVFVIVGLLAICKIAGWFLADVSYARGQTLADSGYVTEAGWAFKKAVRLWPAEPAYHRELAAVYARLARVTSDAEKPIWIGLAQQELDKALGFNLNNLITLKSILPTYLALARIDVSLQERVATLADYAANLCPTDPVVWYLRGLVYLEVGDREKARGSLERVLEFKPDCDKAQRVLNTLVGL